MPCAVLSRRSAIGLVAVALSSLLSFAPFAAPIALRAAVQEPMTEPAPQEPQPQEPQPQEPQPQEPQPQEPQPQE
ncbi:MAG TPA: hypothetical protein PLI18_04340, partial [Pirellulaceae bacterium]|nr:hypothetical protein [Pirellulaceae bacterium]